MSRPIARGLAGLAAVAVSLVLVETLLRLLLPQQLVSLDGPRIWRPDDELGWRMRPHLDTFVNTGEGNVRLVTDARGMRAATRDSPRRVPAPFRILAVGDSFVEALGVDYESTIPRRIEADLSRLLDRSVSVSALAASGWNPHQYLLAARQELRAQRYDLGMVFLYTGNDIVAGTPDVTSAQIGRKHQFGLPAAWSKNAWTRSVLYPLNDFLERRSHLFVFLKIRGATVLARLGLTAAYFPDVFRKTFASSPDWKATVAVYREIRWEFERRGTPVVFVLLPASYQVQREIFQSYVDAFGIEQSAIDLDQPNRILACAFADDSMTLLDPLEAMRIKALRGASLFGQVDRHLNASGARVVSRFLARAIASRRAGELHEAAVQLDENP